MTKEKRQSLQMYANEMKSKLEGAIPDKWKHAPEQYKAFLEREFRLTIKKLDEDSISTKETK